MTNPFAAYRLNELPLLIGVAVVCFIISQTTNHYFSSIGMNVEIIRPNTGFALGVLLLAGKKYWPAIFVGSFISRLALGYSVVGSILIALGVALGAFFGTWLLTRNRKFDPSIPSLNDYLRLLFLAGVISISISAISGTFALVDKGVESIQTFRSLMMEWWMGDTLGIILITPLLLVWRQPPRHWLQRQYLFEAILFFILSFLVGQAVFLGWFHDSLGAVARGYWMFMFVVWGAARLGSQSVVLVLFLTTIQALSGAATGRGFFGTDIAQTQLSNFWFYMINLSLVGMGLASTVNSFKKSEEMIWKQANFDSLTGLPNRHMFRNRMEEELKRAHCASLSFALLFIDIDRFKDVNDTLGHHMGDKMLKEVAHRIGACVRVTDMVARLGGDEFTIIISDTADTGSIERVAQNILQILVEPFQLEDEITYVSASIGITLYPNDATEIDDLLKNADQAMYLAKDKGRNRFSYFTHSMQEAAQARLKLINDLRGALAANQFRVHFQPIVSMSTGHIHKAEALIRWQHPERGLVSPMEFIPLAEETGLIFEIGDWVFHESARWVKHWRDLYNTEFQVSVNKSPIQFYKDGDDHSAWLNHLHSLGLPGQSLVIEITEGLLLHSEAPITGALLTFRDAGIQVAIDDFGTGYSSLSYLKKFDIDYLKIDKSFISNLATGSSDMALSEAIIVMAHKLGFKVIAEGVETEAQRDLLTAAGCDYAQGYLYSKPVPPEEFEVLLV